MVIKKNPYSDRVRRGLEAVHELTAPDYVVTPVDPTANMASAGAQAGNVTREQAKTIYLAMLHAWSLQKPEHENDLA